MRSYLLLPYFALLGLLLGCATPDPHANCDHSRGHVRTLGKGYQRFVSGSQMLLTMGVVGGRQINYSGVCVERSSGQRVYREELQGSDPKTGDITTGVCGMNSFVDGRGDLSTFRGSGCEGLAEHLSDVVDSAERARRVSECVLPD